jgi:hypothetical protein
VLDLEHMEQPYLGTASNQLKSFLNIKCRLQKVTKHWKEEKKPMQILYGDIIGHACLLMFHYHGIRHVYVVGYVDI